MNKTNGIVIALLVILIGLVGYSILKPKDIISTPTETLATNDTNSDSSLNKKDTAAPTSERQNDSIKTFTVNGLFQFKYDSTATVKNNMYGSGVDVYTVYKDGEVSETIKLFKPKLTSFEEYCGPGIEVKQMTINYKDVSYCDSKAEPSRTFFYTRGDRTLKVMCQGTNGKVCSYIIPESVVVYIDPVQGIE